VPDRSSPFLLSAVAWSHPNATLYQALGNNGLASTRGRGGEPDTVAGVTRLGVPLRARGGDWDAANPRTMRSYGHEVQFWIACVTSKGSQIGSPAAVDAQGSLRGMRNRGALHAQGALGGRRVPPMSLLLPMAFPKSQVCGFASASKPPDPDTAWL
jgi:hypothetical protein